MKEQPQDETKDWKCPVCTDTLTIKLKMGEGIKWCPTCNTSWFILCCRRNRKNK